MEGVLVTCAGQPTGVEEGVDEGDRDLALAGRQGGGVGHEATHVIHGPQGGGGEATAGGGGHDVRTHPHHVIPRSCTYAGKFQSLSAVCHLRVTYRDRQGLGQRHVYSW